MRPQGIDGHDAEVGQEEDEDAGVRAEVDREAMREGAELLGVDLDEHLAFVIAALEPHAEELGLARTPAPTSRRVVPRRWRTC